MHVVQIMANNSSVPYFNWFAEEIQKYPEHQFSFIALCPSRPQMIDDMSQRGCDCYWLHFDNTKRKTSILKVVPELVKLFNTIKPDAVNTHLFDDSLPALFAARIAGIKKRFITKGDTTYHWTYAKKWVWADKFNNYNATGIIAISNESKQFILTKEKASPNKVTMIHHGIPFRYACNQNQQFKDELRQKFQLKNKIVIGTVARYIDWKGYIYIIEAAPDIIQKHPNVKFVFAGVGPQHDELLGLINNLGLQNSIILTGWVNREYIPSLYGIMDIYIHAATSEPFGFVIAEAMANGVPLVTTKTGAAADALSDKENCYFIHEKNSSDIVAGVSWMLEDHKRKEEIAIAVKKIAYKMYDVEDMVKNYLNLYINQ